MDHSSRESRTKLFSRFGGQVLVLGLNSILSAPSLVFEVNISLTSVLSSTACVSSVLASTEASCLYAMQLINQIQFSVGVNILIVIKLLGKILGVGTHLIEQPLFIPIDDKM